MSKHFKNTMKLNYAHQCDICYSKTAISSLNYDLLMSRVSEHIQHVCGYLLTLTFL